MSRHCHTIERYIEDIDETQRTAFIDLKKAIEKTIDPRFDRVMNYNMPSYVVPKSIYPAGYKANPQSPLPFASIAAQKSHIALYHMGMYADTELLAWFQNAYKQAVPTKLDMGKSCVRFKNYATIPYDLVSQLFSKVTVDQWVAQYDRAISR